MERQPAFAAAMLTFAFAVSSWADVVTGNSAYVIPRATLNAGDSRLPTATLCTTPGGAYSLRVIPNVAEPMISPVTLLGGGLRLQVGLFTPRDDTRGLDCNNNGIPDECEINQLAWTLRTPSGAMPAPRAYHAMAFDAARGETVLFGGYFGSEIFNGETWAWDGTTWTQKAIGGPAPSPRCCHAMAYDADRQVVVLFGGQTADSQFNDETWEWNGVAWSQKAIGGPRPTARFEHRMAYDSARHLTVLFGGYDITINPFGDTWTWNGTAWTLTDAGGAGRPAPRAQHALAYDLTRQVTVLFGGSTTTPVGAVFGDTWEWNGSAWVERLVNGPRARKIHTMAYDSDRRVTVLFGGHLAPGVEPSHNGETWEWDGTAWTQQLIAGPAPRYNHAMAFDAMRRKTVLFGGDVAGTPYDGHTWELGPIDDCNTNGIPDECEPDCDNDGIPDDCDPGSCCPNFPDCNHNGQNDECMCSTAPVIVTQPTSQPICLPHNVDCLPGNAVLCVAAENPEKQCYQWQKQNPLNPAQWDDLPVAGSHYLGVESPCLTIVGVTIADQGGYRAVVQNGCGTTISNSAALTLLQSVCIFNQPDDIGVPAPVCAGQTYLMQADTIGGGTSVQYQWYRRRAGLPDQLLVGETDQTLLFNTIQTTDAGEYYVIATSDTCNVASRIASVRVYALVGDITCVSIGCQPGDTQDAEVNIADLAKFLSCFGFCSPAPGFDPLCDLVPNGCIDIADLTEFLSHFGQRCP